MGDTSIMARRLEGGNYVQYGFSGNGGYFNFVGERLLAWYKKPKDVEYLFGLGQMKRIGSPGSEYGGELLLFTNSTDGTPHWLGRSEREIFSKIAFVDYGYFYDLDNTWYYIIPGPFRIKVPLEYIEHHLDENSEEFVELRRLKRIVTEYLLGKYYESDAELQRLVKEKYPQGISSIKVDVLSEHEDEPGYKNDPCYRLWDKYNYITDYFDDWVLLKTDDAMIEVTDVLVRKKQVGKRVETIEWEVQQKNLFIR